MHRPLEIKMGGERRQVIGVIIHIMPAIGLRRTAMTAAVVSDDPIAVIEEEQHVHVPIIRRSTASRG